MKQCKAKQAFLLLKKHSIKSRQMKAGAGILKSVYKMKLRDAFQVIKNVNRKGDQAYSRIFVRSIEKAFT